MKRGLLTLVFLMSHLSLHHAFGAENPRFSPEDGTHLSVVAGKSFSLLFPVQLGTGCSWSLQKASETVVEGETVESPSKLPMGGPELPILRLRVRDRGKVGLALSLGRPSAPKEPPERLVRVIIESR